MSNQLCERDFLSNVDYLKQLVKELHSKPFSEYDSNLVYELVYAETYCSTLLAQIKEPKLASNISDILMELQIIASNVDSKHLQDIQNKSDYKKLLSMRYKNVEDASYTEKKMYTDVSGSSIISLYLKKRFHNIIFMFFTFLIVILGLPTKLATFIIDSLIVSKDDSIVFGTFTANTGGVNSVISLFSSGISIIFLAMMMVYSIGLILDLMYLSLPFFRDFLDSSSEMGDKMISIEAKASVMEFDGSTIQYKIIRSYDREKRNLDWLNAMIQVCELAKSTGVGYDKSLHKSLKEVSESIIGNKVKDLTYYKDLVKIEILHERYMNNLAV